MGFPFWANLVTVPSSANPKPKSFHTFAAFPFLSKPAAKPIGLQKFIPHMLWVNLLSTIENSSFRFFKIDETTGQLYFEW